MTIEDFLIHYFEGKGYNESKRIPYQYIDRLLTTFLNVHAEEERINLCIALMKKGFYFTATTTKDYHLSFHIVLRMQRTHLMALMRCDTDPPVQKSDPPHPLHLEGIEKSFNAIMEEYKND